MKYHRDLRWNLVPQGGALTYIQFRPSLALGKLQLGGNHATGITPVTENDWSHVKKRHLLS